MHTIDAAGSYTVRCSLRMNSRQAKDPEGNVIFPAPGDWQATLVTGEAPLYLTEITIDPDAYFVADVVDDETGLPIEKFSVVAGTSPIKGLGWQWQGHTVQHAANGRFQWPEPGKRGYDSQVFRVEADGYAPYQTPPVSPLKEGDVAVPSGAQTGPNGETIPNLLQGRPGEPARFTVRLRRDRGVEGRAVLPSGEPASGAIVAIGMANDEIATIVDGVVQHKPRSRGRTWPAEKRLVTADADGRFTLPAEIQPAAVVVTHPQGVAIMSYAGFCEAPEIKLSSWGTVEGRVMAGDKPLAGVEVWLSARGKNRDPDFDPVFSVQANQTATSDEEGRFRLEHVPPGTAQLSGPDFHPTQFIDVLAEGPTQVVLGGRGRPVVGKLVGREQWDDVTLRAAPNAPRPGDMLIEDGPWQHYQNFLNSKLGKNYVREGVKVSADGTFRIEHMPPAYYQFFVRQHDADDRWKMIGGTKFEIQTVDGGVSDDPLDIGEIRVSPPAGRSDD
ncbi:MAG: carboxypeptidase regulatory-like domain-containing protein [Planctomycetales bacterium]|nr:carboxypeptidase regulatory-like domain-containing protein [Planctomycetales bacterium]